VNARHLSPDELYGPEHAPGDKASLAVMDVSFISILKILPALDGLLAESGLLMSLLKPQFEAPASDNRKGIVSDPKAHARVLKMIRDEAPATGWHLHQADVSPIRGKSGNLEFLGVFYRHPPAREPDIEALIRRAHAGPNSGAAATGPSEAESSP
jgi:23S rRNA (cytidine1920-2'-O)/16S rRNA (cytidine1409-2'-O)-methyltransferase